METWPIKKMRLLGKGYKHSGEGWVMVAEGPRRGWCLNTESGEWKELEELVAWMYGLSVNEARRELKRLLHERGMGRN